jgi:hypothetical protein
MVDALEVLFFIPILLGPLGIYVLVQARETVTWVGGLGMVSVGGGWAWLLWQLIHCDENASCGLPEAVGVMAAIAVLAGALAIVVAGLVLVSRRFRRGRRSPAP